MGVFVRSSYTNRLYHRTIVDSCTSSCSHTSLLSPFVYQDWCILCCAVGIAARGLGCHEQARNNGVVDASLGLPSRAQPQARYSQQGVRARLAGTKTGPGHKQVHKHKAQHGVMLHRVSSSAEAKGARRRANGHSFVPPFDWFPPAECVF